MLFLETTETVERETGFWFHSNKKEISKSKIVEGTTTFNEKYTKRQCPKW